MHFILLRKQPHFRWCVFKIFKTVLIIIKIKLTIPYNKSKARNLIDSSLSSKHCIIKSLCDWTVFGCVLRILDIANNPKYFTKRKITKLKKLKTVHSLRENFNGKIAYSFDLSLQLKFLVSEHIAWKGKK